MDNKELELKQYAEKLHNREYRNELNRNDILEAKEKWIVIVYWASDDLCELDWAICDEVWCWEWWDVYFYQWKVLRNECSSDCPYFDILVAQAKSSWNHIEIISDDNWRSYKTTIQHETFDILEDWELYCKWIVFYIDSLK